MVEKTQNYRIDTQSIPEYPLSFTTPQDEFVDRQDEISLLLKMIDLVKVRGGANYVIIGRRRIGKSAIVERIYNYLWNSQKEIIPLYFSFVGKKNSFYLKSLNEMFEAFLKQYYEYRYSVDPEELKKMDIDALIEKGLSFEDRGLRSALNRYIGARKSGLGLEQAITTLP